MDGLLSSLTAVFSEACTRAAQTHCPVLAALSFDVEMIDPLVLFTAFDDGASPCVYWESDTPRMSMFGWGCALELTASGSGRFLEIDRSWCALLESAVMVGREGPRLVGGFRFDVRTQQQTHWGGFADANMVLADALVIRREQSCAIVCQRMINEGDDPIELARQADVQANALLGASTASPVATERARCLYTSTLPPHKWQNKVRQAVKAIRRREIDKVVIARELMRSYEKPICVSALLERLRLQNRGVHFFAVRKPQGCFLGASPERLVRVDAGKVTTHALAGTTSRGSDAESDHALGVALMSSEKERMEHAIVVDSIRSALDPLTCALDIPDRPELRVLSRLQHLSTPIHATCLPQVGVLKLVDALHPTPAVAGHSREAAMAFIRSHEGFDRGWYAAPLGWVDAQGNGDFLVALRSALINGPQCRMFAGCGIVTDSEAEREYQETCAKLSGMLTALEAV